MIRKQTADKRKHIALLMMILGLLFLTTGIPDVAHSAVRIWHVAKNGSDFSGSGSTTKPFVSIQRGIDAAGNGDNVSVHPGTYTEWISFRGKNIVVESSEGFENTIIDGSKSRAATTEASPSVKGAVTFEGEEDNSAVLRGFTIQNAPISGIYCLSSGPTLEYLKITHNSAVSGAGIFCDEYAAPVIKNSVISNNTSKNRGGGIYSRNYSHPILKNLEITNNSAYSGGGIYCDTSELSLTYITISDNSAVQGNGIFIQSTSVLSLRNTIIWNNEILLDDEEYMQKPNNLIIFHSDIQGGQNGIMNSHKAIINWSAGNIDANPLFVNPEAGDYRLSDPSPCIETGMMLPDEMDNTDIYGSPRPTPAGSDPDMGAYENQAQDIYVDAMFSGAEAGSRSTPYKTIAKAIENATPGSTIHVAEGTYTGALTVKNIDDLRITGGWTGNRWTRPEPADPNFTVIMANGSSTAVLLSHASNIFVEGFTIVGDQVGMRIENVSGAEIRNNIIRIGSDGELAGIQCESSSGQIIRNRIHIAGRNPDTSSGDGITLKSLSGDMVLENNIIYLEGNTLRGIREVDENATPATHLHNEFYSVENAILYGDANGRGNIRTCERLNNSTLDDIPDHGGNICNVLPQFSPCTPPCADIVTIPTPEDTDGDGIPDNEEVYYFGDMSNDSSGDTDGDELTDLDEYINGTDPTLWDTDGDSIADNWEVLNGMNPLDDDARQDADNDGYSNFQEYEGGTDPNNPDEYPFIQDDIVTTEENTSVTIPVLENDDGNNLTIVSVTQAEKGTVQTISKTYLRYIPSRDFQGTDSFEYTTQNQKGHTGKAQVMVYVRPVPLSENALSFDGTNDYVIRNSVNNYPSEEMTVEFWIRSAGTGYQSLFSYAYENADNGFSIALDENSVFHVYMGDKEVTGGSVEDNNWHHVAVTWQSSDGKIKIFRDGYAVLSGTFTRDDAVADGGFLVLGNSQGCVRETGDCQSFSGEMDDVRLWNYARLQEDVQRDMNKHLRGDENGLAGYWRFDEEGGQTAFDYSPNGNHGQMGSKSYADDNDPRSVTTSPLIPRMIYVDGSLSGDTEAGSVSSPYMTIGKAIRVAPPDSSIRVAKGTYPEALTLSNIDGLKIEGGWNHTPGIWNRDDPINPNFTVIMAPDSPVAVRMLYAPDTVFEGFTVFGTETGVSVENSDNAQIRNNIIRVTDDGEDAVGIHCINMSGRVAGNRVHLASRTKPAHGMVLQNLPAAPLLIENNIIYMQGGDMTGILELRRDATPDTLLNNEFYGDKNARLYWDGNRRGIIRNCAGLNDDTLNDIPNRGGNFCNLLQPYKPCLPPCADVVMIPEPEDTDEDGMPNNWEVYYFGDISHDGTADEDGDGQTDLEEYAEKTKPVSWDIKVTLRPQRVTDEGAQWSTDGGLVWRDSEETVSVSESFMLDFKDIPGWNAPSRQTITPVDGQPLSIIVMYSLENYTLTISGEGCEGNVKVNGEAYPLPWDGQFVSGEQVSLESVSDTDCNFLYWSGDIIDTANAVELTMDGNKAVKAIFTAVGTHFALPQSTPVYMDMEGKIYDALNNKIAEGDELAVYVSDGNDGLLTVGYSLYGEDGYFVRVYGDDKTTPEKDGVAQGDTLILKTYSQREEMKYSLHLISDAYTYEEGTQKICNWRYRNIQRIPLHTGWNMISFNVNKCFYTGTKPACDMIEGIEYEQVNTVAEILSSIDGQYSYIRSFDCTGTKSYNLTQWSDMSYMAAGYGYEIRINEDADVDENGLIHLELEGSLVSGKTPIPLQPGWNFVGYLGGKVLYTGATPPALHYPEDTTMNSVRTIGDAFCSIDGKYMYVEGFDKTGIISYNLTRWSNLKYVGPGYGYWLKVNDGEQPYLIWDSQCNSE